MTDTVVVSRPGEPITVRTIDTRNIVTRAGGMALVNTGAVGPRGAPGLPGDFGQWINFAYGDAYPALLVVVPAGKRIYRTAVHVHTGFDQPASISVGTMDDPDALVPSLFVDAQTVASYEANPHVKYTVNTGIYLFVTPGVGSSAGSGQVSLLIEP